MAFNDPRNTNSLFTREILFRDGGNRPIPNNRALLARGDGGTYWADTTVSTQQQSFTAFRASTINYTAANACNTLWIEPGTGIQFYSTIEAGRPVTWIASKGPETLNVVGQGSIDLLNLPDNLTTGRTLTFKQAGDLYIHVSDATVTFDANNTSSFSTIVSLQETTAELQSTTQGILDEVKDVENTINTLLLSSAVSTFWSTLMYTKDLAESLSTFTYSTFNISSGVLNITYPDVFISSLTVNEFKGPFRSTFSSIYWSSAFGVETQTSNITISTIRNFNYAPLINFDNVNNRIGINLGLTPPRTTVDVNGIVYGSAFVTSSDRRLKTDIQPFISNKIPEAYRFTWIRDGTSDIGCMADEVEAVAPECVIVGADGFKAVNYSKLVPVCLSLIKDLTERVRALENRS
jgi:hypothetical protein